MGKTMAQVLIEKGEKRGEIKTRQEVLHNLTASCYKLKQTNLNN